MHFGESYFGFCQAVLENEVPCACVAVDTWKGDQHSEFYGEEVFDEVEAYNRAHYSSFSTLLRCTFEEALPGFADLSIDLLHIDGLHTYEAISQEFQHWLPKVRPGGIILLHDIMARGNDFGVWKFWEEVSARFQSFEFHHSSGLGVLRVPGPPLPDHQFFRDLFERERPQEKVLRYYRALSEELEYFARVAVRQGLRSELWVTVYPCSPPGYGELDAIRTPLRSGQWERLTFHLQHGSQGPIRVDPVQKPAFIEIAEIQVRRTIDDTLLWRAGETGGFADVQPAGDVVMRVADNRLHCFSFGFDPQLILPDLPREQSDQPLRVEISLKADTEISSLIGWPNSNMLALPKLSQIVSSELSSAQDKLYSTRQLLNVSQREISDLRNALSKMERELELEHQTLSTQTQQMAALRYSYSWRLTKPLRWLAAHLNLP